MRTTVIRRNQRKIAYSETSSIKFWQKLKWRFHIYICKIVQKLRNLVRNWRSKIFTAAPWGSMRWCVVQLCDVILYRMHILFYFLYIFYLYSSSFFLLHHLLSIYLSLPRILTPASLLTISILPLSTTYYLSPIHTSIAFYLISFLLNPLPISIPIPILISTPNPPPLSLPLLDRSRAELSAAPARVLPEQRELLRHGATQLTVHAHPTGKEVRMFVRACTVLCTALSLMYVICDL